MLGGCRLCEFGVRVWLLGARGSGLGYIYGVFRVDGLDLRLGGVSGSGSGFRVAG